MLNHALDLARAAPELVAVVVIVVLVVGAVTVAWYADERRIRTDRETVITRELARLRDERDRLRTDL